MASVFTSSLRLCAEAGMVNLGVVALDGTKMGCPAALDANRTKDHIEEAVKKMLEEAEAADAAEDAALRPRRHRRRAARAPAGSMQLAASAWPQAKAVLDAQDKAAQEAHEAHLAQRAEKEETSGKKLRGRKPKTPDTSEAKVNVS